MGKSGEDAMREGIKLAKKLQQCIIQCASLHRCDATWCWPACLDAAVVASHPRGVNWSHEDHEEESESAPPAGMAAWRSSGICGRTSTESASGTCHSRTSRTGPCWCAFLTVAVVTSARAHRRQLSIRLQRRMCLIAGAWLKDGSTPMINGPQRRSDSAQAEPDDRLIAKY